MSTDTIQKLARPSVLGGAMIIAGTAVGAGMFSIPIVTSGVWFSGSVALLVYTWACMLLSGLMILEATLHYPSGASFNTMVKDLLGKGWNAVNGLSVAFVLYILTYAYISAGGSIIAHTLEGIVGVGQTTAGLVFALVVAFIVWLSTRAVDRLSTILIGGMVITFVMSVGDMFTHVQPAVLFNTDDDQASYLPYALAALPYLLTSFGYHGNIPGLVKYYHKDSSSVVRSLVYGTLLALAIYILWQYVIQGNIARDAFKQVIAEGGNIGSLLKQMGNVSSSQTVSQLLNAFSYMALASSFLGVSLGLFDYLADFCKFKDDAVGRSKTALVTFVPPTLAALLFPNGFLYAIGFAGLAATIWAVIVPALMARASRRDLRLRRVRRADWPVRSHLRAVGRPHRGGVERRRHRRRNLIALFHRRNPCVSKEFALRPALPWRQQLFDFLYKWGMLLTVAALIALFGLASDNFLDANNIINILRSIAIVTVIAIGVSISLSVGGFDLSVGSTASLANALVISLFVWHGFGTTGAIVVTLLLCTLVGLFNALLIVVFRIPDMLATLASLFVIQGVAMTYSYGGSITQNMVLPNGDMAEGLIPEVFSALGQVPVIVLIMLAVTVAVQLFLSLTKHGRRMYAIGGNPEAARLSGIRTVRYRVAAYVISSWLAALGGILLASRIGSSQVNAGGGYLMDAVAAAYIGFSLAGSGKPNALGTLIGAVILGVLQNGLVMLSVPYYAMDIIKGLVLALALAITYIQKR